MVAMKRLNREFGQGDLEFWKEIMMLSRYKHKNIVSLLGYCHDNCEKILVYELAPKRSLELYLNSSELTWVGPLQICIGAAHGLAYLHSAFGTQQRVLHRDIKSSNILLDDNWNAKISDFGLAKFGPANQEFTFLFSNAVGTHGYCDPLYSETGFLTKESDVYSFGVVLFEVLCGRLCLDFKNKTNKLQPLIGMVRKSYEQNTIHEIIYGNIKDEINPDSLKAFTKIAYQCLMRDREERPLMTDIARELETALQYQILKDQAPYLFPETSDLTALDRAQATHPAGIEEYASKVGGLLVITIHEGNNLKAKHPFIILHIGQDIRRTTTMKNNQNPVWEETFKFTFHKPPTNTSLYLVVSSSSRMDKYLNQNVFGDLYISLADVIKEKQIDKVYQLQNGRIHVELQWEPSALPVKTKPKMLQFLSSVYNVGIKGVQGE